MNTNDYIINYSEAVDECERLKKVTGRHFVVVRESCDCDYSKDCLRCAGEGTFLEVVEQTVVKVEGARLKSCAQVAEEAEEAEWEAANA